MRQTKKHSFVESLANVFVGWGVGVSSQLVLFPLFNIYVPFKTNLWLSVWFTVISIVRSYIIRRWFTQRTSR